MLNDWLDHLDRMFRASFQKRSSRPGGRTGSTSLRIYGAGVRAPHDGPAARPHFEVLDGAARAWGLR
jgi:hypothetical protein